MCRFDVQPGNKADSILKIPQSTRDGRRLYISHSIVLADSNIAVSSNTMLVTVKPFNLAAQKVGDLACKIILAPFILAN